MHFFNHQLAFGSTKTWAAILNSVQKVQAITEPATPKQRRCQDTLLTPSPKKKPKVFTTLFSSPTLDLPFSLAGSSSLELSNTAPSEPAATSPASTTITEPATSPEDIEDVKRPVVNLPKKSTHVGRVLRL